MKMLEKQTGVEGYIYDPQSMILILGSNISVM